MKTGDAFRDLLARSPPEFTRYFEHVRGLAFEAEPDYALLRAIFVRGLGDRGWTHDGKYDWTDLTLCPKGTLIPEEYLFDEAVANSDVPIGY